MSAAENELRCNNLKCRRLVATEGKAVVTICSHVFCISCANELFSVEQICPACDQVLSEQDDIVISCLNPSTDYKSSVLAGLTPGIILEIASRAMAFWTYQTAQESSFQSILLKNSKDQVIRLEQELNIARGELNTSLRRNKELEDQLYNASRTNQNFIQESREKDKEMTKLRGNFDKIKRRTLLGTAAQALEAPSPHPHPQVLSAIPPNLRPVHHAPSHAGTPSRNAPQPFVPTPNGRGRPQHHHQNQNQNTYHPYGGGMAGGGTPVNQVQQAQHKRFQGLAGGSRLGPVRGVEPRYGGAGF